MRESEWVREGDARRKGLPWGVRAKVRAAAVRNELATIHIEGLGGTRKARNTMARMGTEKQWLIVSTPQSGWFTCGGERGPGVAISLALSAWAARKGFRHSLMFVATSGHEWADAGAHLFHEHETPGPDNTALWVHLGASFGSREYRQGSSGLEPLEAAIPGCVFMASADMMDAAKAAFAGVPSLPPQVASIERSAGELTLVLKEGYKSSAGFFGFNAKFHTQGDGADSTTGAIMDPIARAVAAMIEARLTRR